MTGLHGCNLVGVYHGLPFAKSGGPSAVPHTSGRPGLGAWCGVAGSPRGAGEEAEGCVWELVNTRSG